MDYSGCIIKKKIAVSYSRCNFSMMVKWANDGILQANDGKMLINDGEMLVKDGEMSVWSYTHLAWSKPSYVIW